MPAVFWSSAPNNFWYDNVGTNSDSAGFWFELDGAPNNAAVDGTFGTCPVNEPLGQFSNMSFHYNAAFGFRIYPSYQPRQDPCDAISDTAPQYFYGMVSFGNGVGMFNKHIGDLHYINASFVENGQGASIISYDTNKLTRNPNFLGVFLVESIDPNFEASSGNAGSPVVFLPQNEYFYLEDTTVINSGQREVFSACNECDTGEEFRQGGFTTIFKNTNFINSSIRIRWTPHFKEIFWDVDGSLIGEEDGMITYNYPYNAWSDCYLADTITYDNSMICKNSTKIRRFAVDNFQPDSSLRFTALTVASSEGAANIPFLPRDLYGWVTPLVDGHEYAIIWNNSGASDGGQSATAFRLGLSTAPYLEETADLNITESLVISYTSFRYDSIPALYNLTLYGSVYQSSNHTVSLTDVMGSSFYNQTTRELDVVLSNNGADFSQGDAVTQVSAQALLCSLSGCPVPPRYSASNYTFWSDISSWYAIGGYPIQGQNFNISADQWIVLDVSPPPLGIIQIFGRLSFLSGHNMTITLSATTIQVFGLMDINGYVTSSGFNASQNEFNGSAVINLYGSRDTIQVPPPMAEGLFLGSKYIGVAGTFSASGLSRPHYKARLSSTASSGTSTISLVSYSSLGWLVGDEIVITTTSYFNANGTLWDDPAAPSNERRFITGISMTQLSSDTVITIITMDRPLLQTHICTTVLSESFCASAALLTRSIQIISSDITGNDDGFGGYLAVVDAVYPINGIVYTFVGQVFLNAIQMTNMGKINTNYNSVWFYFRQKYAATYFSSISACSIVDGFNYGIYVQNANSIILNDNIVHRAYGGGIYIDQFSSNVTITSNMVLSVGQVPARYLNGYLWTVPVAAFNFRAFSGVYRENIAAGCYDSGFHVATSVFTGYSGISTPSFNQPLYSAIQQDNLCALTLGVEAQMNTSQVSSILHVFFSGNEAVGCRVGFMVVNQDQTESIETSCAVVTGMKAWRSAHIGIGGVDSVANVLVHKVILAENFIGVSFSHVRTSYGGYSGVLNSIIIGSLSSTPCTGDSPSVSGTTWQQKCQAFSFDDPFGTASTCQSVLADTDYTRVGILIPQWTNRGKTCTMNSDLSPASCSVEPLLPDRLCGLPWEKRYALPMEYLYSEHHVRNVSFTGFSSDPSCATRGAAIALNPSQIDVQPVVVTSSLNWAGEDVNLMDIGARVGLEIPASFQCTASDCMGQNLLTLNDARGLLLRTADQILPDDAARANVSGQISFDLASWSSSNPTCQSVPLLSSSMIACLNDIPNTVPFHQYTALVKKYFISCSFTIVYTS